MVQAGSKLTQQTKNAAIDMEEPFDCLHFDDEEATGAAPGDQDRLVQARGDRLDGHLDTAGSGFDTVVAVYKKAADGSYVPVSDACVDDVPVEPVGRTLQSAVTFGAPPGRHTTSRSAGSQTT